MRAESNVTHASTQELIMQTGWQTGLMTRKKIQTYNKQVSNRWKDQDGWRVTQRKLSEALGTIWQ